MCRLAQAREGEHLGGSPGRMRGQVATAKYAAEKAAENSRHQEPDDSDLKNEHEHKAPFGETILYYRGDSRNKSEASYKS